MLELLNFAWLVVVLWLLWLLYFTVPIDMANDRQRSPTFWMLLGFVVSPFLSIVLLWALGEAE